MKVESDFFRNTGFDWQEVEVNKAKLQHIEDNLYMYKGMYVYQVDPQKDKDFRLRYPGEIHWLHGILPR